MHEAVAERKRETDRSKQLIDAHGPRRDQGKALSRHANSMAVAANLSVDYNFPAVL